MMYIKKLCTLAKYLCLTIYRSKVLKKFILRGGVHPPQNARRVKQYLLTGKIKLKVSKIMLEQRPNCNVILLTFNSDLLAGLNIMETFPTASDIYTTFQGNIRGGCKDIDPN